MNKMLVLNAHPDVESNTSVTLNVLESFLQRYRELVPDGEVEQLHLYRDEVPLLDHVALTARSKSAAGELITPEEQAVTDRTNELLRQFKGAKNIVIAMPMHNFNIPSKLKDYMDAILIPRETYTFTHSGSVGLLKDGRSVLVIQGSGSIYTNNDWYTEVEYSHQYLRSMFTFMGFDSYEIIRAQGNAVLPKENVLEQAKQEALQAAERYAHRMSGSVTR
uniref:FMN-dependent NADH-azoreductase n=1 Tax=Paenibacillus terrae TaxID=159743 RepID=UPI0011A4B14C|nr:NAD(P)H-dependent oxidoreductase [Paenibacillus terrae]